jgi:hypothetical protein
MNILNTHEKLGISAKQMKSYVFSTQSATQMKSYYIIYILNTDEKLSAVNLNTTVRENYASTNERSLIQCYVHTNFSTSWANAFIVVAALSNQFLYRATPLCASHTKLN